MLATPKTKIENHIWVTSYKEKIPVKKMTTKHVKNCIACWNGNGYKTIPPNYLGGYDKWIRIFSNELINRK